MFNIIQITDCHVFSDTSKIGYHGINPFSSLKRILLQVKNAQVDKLIVTGDISGDGTKKSYQHFLNLITQYNLLDALLVVPGNHDNLAHMYELLPEKSLGSDSPHIALADNWHLHLLDTKTAQSVGHLSEASIDSLTKYLSMHANGYHLIASHHHPVPCRGWMDKHEWQNRQVFTDIVAAHPRVKGVIYGHIHMAKEDQQAHCLYMACPSTCWQFANQQNFALSVLKPGYRVLNLTKDGQINTSVQRLLE